MVRPPPAACSRRDFLSGSVYAACGALAASVGAAAATASPLGGPVGIQLYAVREQLRAEPRQTLRTIREIGFGEVETAGLAGLSAAAFRRLLDEAGLKCPSAHLQFDRADFGPAFEQAHALGARYAASGSLRDLVASSDPTRQVPAAATAPPGMSLDEARRTAELANRIGEQARRAGLQYVYHNHAFEFAAQPFGMGYDVLLRETDAALVQFEIDCGWMILGGGDPREYFKARPGRFPLIHVKDFSPPAAHAAERAGAELGHGMIDYAPIFAAAEQAGLQHYYAEQEGPFAHMTQLEAARQAYEYLRKLH